MKRRAKDFIGAEVMVNDVKGFVAQCNRRKGITIKRYSTYNQKDMYCLNRNAFPLGKAGYAAYIELFDTVLEWINSGDIKWNALIHTRPKRGKEYFRIFDVNKPIFALMSSCPFA